MDGEEVCLCVQSRTAAALAAAKPLLKAAAAIIGQDMVDTMVDAAEVKGSGFRLRCGDCQMMWRHNHDHDESDEDEDEI